MFTHLFFYRLKTVVRTKEEFFWILMFPILLGTFFYVAFGNISKTTENFSAIPVAIVMEEESAEPFFDGYIKALSEGEEPVLKTSFTDQAEAENLLKKEKITGYLLVQNGNVSLCITKSGIYQSILKEIVDGYVQSHEVMNTAVLNDPQCTEAVINTLSSTEDYIRHLRFTKGNTDVFVDYYYSLIAMACLFAAFSGQSCAEGLLANLSAQGMRKCLSPVHRMKMILSDVLASCTFPVIANVTVVCYLRFLLKINLGGKLPLIFGTSILGTIIGVMIGLCVGSIYQLKKDTKTGILTTISLVSSFLSGLMVQGIKYKLDKTAPFINKLNPATVITDALYSLNIYDTYQEYALCMGILATMSILLCIISYCLIRREYYADL